VNPTRSEVLGASVLAEIVRRRKNTVILPINCRLPPS
jgi:hypothetical protein